MHELFSITTEITSKLWHKYVNNNEQQQALEPARGRWEASLISMTATLLRPLQQCVVVVVAVAAGVLTGSNSKDD